MNQNIKIDPYGFREYDARWLYEKDISKEGITNLGKGLGTQIKKHTQKENPRVIVGHDYRSYSEEIKSALKKGLISTGCYIEDVGLSLSPMVYFAQFNLDADAVAMVTASHNENGWTGVKMGIKKGLTHAPKEMKEKKEITLNEKFSNGEGNEKQIENFQQIYKDDLINGNKINKKLKAVVACGNGTAGVFAPDILRGIGCDVVELDCELDWTFPKYNPNPEDLEMLHAIAKAVKDNNADIGFGFDGDGEWYDYDKHGKNVRWIEVNEEDSKENWYVKKKNMVVENSNFDNIVYSHDYFVYDSDWYDNFKEFGEDWDLCMCVLVNKDGHRYRDWFAWDDIPLCNEPKINDNWNPNHDIALVPYDYNKTNKMSISGAWWVAKKHVMISEPINESLRWGEGEDTEWSMRVRDKYKYVMNTKSIVRLLRQKRLSSYYVEGDEKYTTLGWEKNIND